MTRKFFLTRAGTFGAVAALTLTACGAQTTQNAQTRPSASTSTSTTPAPITEGKGAASRVAITYDGGVFVYDAKDMKLLADIPKEGFLRLSDAGNNRHLVVADGNSYTFLDTGVWSVAHGDHSHYYTTSPSLSSLSLVADHTGHVIKDNGKVTAFADGTGSFAVYDPAKLTHDKRTVSSLETTTVTLPQPHHGFAIPLPNDQYLVAVGDSKTRTGAAVVDAQGKTVTESPACPGVHGEAIAKDGAFSIGYKTDKDAKLERPEKFSIIDTVAATRTVYALPSGVSYTFRSLARGPQGEALLLTTDGKLRIFDPATGAELGSVQLMEAWTESETWQDERPALWVDGKTAYVTDPAAKKLIAVSLSNPVVPKELMSVELPKTPNEILGVSSSHAAPVESEAQGAASSSASADTHESGEAHEGHSH